MLKFSRLYKHAEWASVVPTTVDGIQVLTDAMSYGSDIQLNYKGSGWRDVMPYGWNSSKDGNVLLMCYKDTGEIRSYRLDRINELWVHDSILNPEESSDFDDFEIPELPDMDEIIKATEAEEGTEKPFDEAIETLESDNNALMNMYNDFNVNPNDIDESYDELIEQDEFGNSINENEQMQIDDNLNEFDIPDENLDDNLNDDFNNDNINLEDDSNDNSFLNDDNLPNNENLNNDNSSNDENLQNNDNLDEGLQK